MGTKAETLATLLTKVDYLGSNSYLFFGDELHVGDPAREQHNQILLTSNRQIEEIKVAGLYSVSPLKDMIIISGSGSGSGTLSIVEKDPKEVVEFVKSFPDFGDQEIISKE